MIDHPGSEAALAQQKLAALWQACETSGRIRFQPPELMTQYEGLVSRHGLLVSAFRAETWQLVEICFNVVPRNPAFALPRYWEFDGDFAAAEREIGGEAPYSPGRVS